jgi:hypothetical protein
MKLANSVFDHKAMGTFGVATTKPEDGYIASLAPA